MIQIQKHFISLSSLLILYSCQGNDSIGGNGISSDSVGIYRETNIWYYDSTKQIHIKAQYLNDTLDGELLEYYPSGNLKKIETYRKGKIVDSAWYFYESGQIHKRLHYRDYYAEKDYFLNTCVVYDLYGKIIDEESYYYNILNTTDSFKHNTEGYLQFELTCPFFNDKSELILGEFDETFRPLGKNIEKIEIEDFRVSVPLNTKSLGNQTIRFIVNDYRWKNDSVQQVKPLLVSYDYVVVE